MHILMVHNTYTKTGGEEDASQALADLLEAHGHAVSWFRRSSEELGDPIFGKTKAFFTGIYNPASVRQIAQVLDERKPDLVQVQNLYPLISHSILRELKRRGLPVVMRASNYRLFCPNGLFYTHGKVCESCTKNVRELWCIVKNCEGSILKSTGYAARNAYARISGSFVDNVDIFIVQSHFQKEKFMKFGLPENRIEILPAFYQKEGPGEEEEETGKFISYVGRVSREKGITHFIEAARQLPKCRFAVAGRHDGFERLVTDSPANVTWAGFLTGKELRSFYRDSKVIVIPSVCYEGFPNVAVQAMLHKRPLICSNLGVFKSFIEDQKNGLLFEPGDPRDLVDKISKLLADEELSRRLVRNAYSEALQKFNPDAIYKKLIWIYEQAIRSSKETSSP